MKPKQKSLTSYNRWGYAFVAPFVIVFLIFHIYPVIRTLYLSFTDLKVVGTGNWIWFDNYIRVFTDKFFWKALLNTIRIWGVNIVLQLGLAFLLVIIFTNMSLKIRGLHAFRIVYYLPNLIAATSIAFLFQTLLDQRFGTFNVMISGICNLFGVAYQPIDWLGSPATAPYVIAVIQSWIWFGNSFLMLMASVQSISKDYFEAARIDGANTWAIFKNITLPLINPIMMYVAMTSLIGGLQMFDLPYLMIKTNSTSYSSVETVMMYLYKFGFTTGSIQTGYASAVAYSLFIIIFGVTLVQMKFFNKNDQTK